MPKYKVLASQVIYLVRTLEADSKERAWQIAIDDGEWKDYEATAITHIETTEMEANHA